MCTGASLSASSLVLASASPRRRELLRQIGVQFEVLPQDIDESARIGETPSALVSRLAQQKACAALAQVVRPGVVVLGSDTVVVLGETMLGKPQSQPEAVSMLMRLANTEHDVLTAVCVAINEKQDTVLSASTVRFRAISEAEANAYWATGEPVGKAGGYGIQGLGAVFVESIHGSYSGIMGLPLYETARLLYKFGVSCWLPTGKASSDEPGNIN